MIATPRLHFIHVHKTGGQFVNRLLLQHLPDARRVGYHLPRSEAPADLRRLPAFAFVRNPWDWYVSWYAFNAASPERNPIFRGVADSGRVGFKHTLANLLWFGDEAHAALRQAVAAQLPETRENNFGSGITRAVMQTYAAPETGYFSWLVGYMCAVEGSLKGLHMGRMEALREDLPRLLQECGAPPSDALRQAIAAAPAVNASPRRDYRGYYDPESMGWVAERDRAIIEEYGYRF
ncbi:MAG: hypothetical protein ACM3ZT_12760 [Bacillota bacterium]